ncbi:MAG: family 20 glycosylhydrolase [Saprospiraceae bacterium]
MNRLKFGFVIIIIIFFTSCKKNQKVELNSKTLITTSIAFEWILDSLDAAKGISYITHTIINNSTDTLDRDWTIYYNQLVGGPNQKSIPISIKVDQVNGTFYSIKPTNQFPILGPKDAYSYQYQMPVPVIRQSDVPLGMYLVKGEGSALTIKNVNITGLNSEVLSALPLENATKRYKENGFYKNVAPDIENTIIPAAKSVESGNGTLELNDNINYSISGDLENEANWLKYLLTQSFSGQVSKNKKGQIQLILNNLATEKEGTYSLIVNDKNVIISSSTKSGIINGISSLAQLINANYYKKPSKSISLPFVKIEDSPDYSYRGLMLDVARHFHSAQSVKSILDMMAFYKLNKFHWHLGDDEGWRVEIPDLPELTDVGARRGHTLDEVASGHLQPAYGSGPHPAHSYGSGWYSREEYIDILRYAAARHIEVIPEFDMPGHARAAITAMKVRYKKYMKEGNKEEAERYLLSDPADISVYNSAQGYGDNSFCVCRESTFAFVEKVLQEVIAMHEEAGAPLTTFHSGGDEVAYGSWQKSPVCKDFIKANSESISHSDDLQPYFTNRYKSLIAKYGLVTAGWEEYLLKNSSEGHDGKVLNPKFIGENMMPFVWNATWGWGREDMAYKLANAGYKTVMCNSAQLYFDMAYNMDPEETGLMWTGMVDAQNPYYLVPEDIYSLPRKKNKVGAVIDDDLFSNHIRLTEEGKKNILGIQGHLWSETVTSNEKIQYYLFPKSLSLSERAWNAYPQWADISDKEERWATMQKDWSVFTNKIGQHHMPLMDHLWGGIGYRIPLPGMAINNGKLNANIRYSGLRMRYTTDGSEVTRKSKVYNGPFTVTDNMKNIKMRAFTDNGRMSRESVLEL